MYLKLPTYLAIPAENIKQYLVGGAGVLFKQLNLISSQYNSIQIYLYM